MPWTNCFTFFKNNSKLQTFNTSLYISTKIGHELRLNYSLFSQSVKEVYKEQATYAAAKQLAYLLPVFSSVSSLLQKDSEIDKGALLWALVNGFQCYLPVLSDSKAYCLGAYTIDVFLGYLKDRTYLETQLEYSCMKKFNAHLEVFYALSLLGVNAANLFSQTSLGLFAFGISLILKPMMLARNQISKTRYHLLTYALINSLAPAALLFSVDSDYNLVFGLLSLSLSLYLLNPSSKERSQSDQSCQTV